MFSLSDIFGLPVGVELITQIIFGFEWALRLLALFVVPRNRKPTSGTAWLLLIFLVPVPGWIIFLFIGSAKLPKSRRNLQSALDSINNSEIEAIKERYGSSHHIVDVAVQSKYQSLAVLAKALGHLPVLAANNAQTISDYQTSIRSIAADIDTAQQTVYMEYFTLAYDETTQPVFIALRKAVERGVHVHVLYDYYGCYKYAGFGKVKRELKSAGISFHSMLPIRLPGPGYVRPDIRNHRKLVVIDHSTAYIGSQNMIAAGYHRKDDLSYAEMVVRLNGPIAYQLAAVFEADWLTETDSPLQYIVPDLHDDPNSHTANKLLQVLPSGPGYTDENNLKLFTHLIHLAERSVTIVNPYFVPSEALTTAIVSAAKRGVRVRMLNSQISDQLVVAHAQRSYYEELLGAGVEIYLHNRPVLVHSKFIIVDDEIATVGTSNLDLRSFELDHEITLVAYDAALTQQLAQAAEKYIANAAQVNPATWRQRRPIVRLVDNLARLTSSLQ